jgi:hypothetical protein
MSEPIQRETLPIPDPTHVGLTTFDAKDPNTVFPPIVPLRPPSGAPNVLIVLVDDVGFGASSAFGGPATRRRRSDWRPVACSSRGSTRRRCVHRRARRS